MTRPIAAVTGATGFLGRHIARALDARGYRVRMLARRDPLHPLLAGLDAEVVAGGLFDAAALERLVGGAALVVHAAGLVKAARERDFWAVNRDGAGLLARAVRRRAAGARLVLVSSLAARSPGLSPYGASKRAGETAVTDALGPGADWVVVRPTAIYGPWDRELLIFFQAADRGLMAMPGRADARLTMVHVEDAAADIALIAAAAPGGRAYAVADGNPGGYGWADLGRAMAAVVGRRLRPVRIPRAALLLAARAAAAGAWASGRSAMISPGKVNEITHPDWSIAAEELAPIAAAKRSLGDGFGATADWYREAGWLPPKCGHRPVL
jgi:nucleoside-diphosphate-sugar epimerase